MSAYVESDFRRGFILDEERVRKINELIHNRLATDQNYPCPVYKVYRSDNFTYTTTNIEDIFKEDNGDSQKVVRILILIEDEQSKLKFDLDFDVRYATSLKIEGENRDLVFLLFSDLRQYMANEVTICKRISTRSLHLLLFLIPLTLLGIIFIALMTGLLQAMPATSAKLALESQNALDKLNFLISSQEQISIALTGGQNVVLFFLGLGACMVLTMVIAMINRDQLLRLSNSLFIQDLFLFGKEIKRHEIRQRRRSNIFWGIIVATVVSVIAGLIVWLATKS